MPFFVYICLCRNLSYYVGMTSDIDRRMEEHFKHEGAKYTRENWIVKLLWHERHETRESALRRESKIKRWTRRKKEALIQGNLLLLKQL